eukprot:scaffold69_cov248-Pinguiococcus_pyrenoidosus.AAC.87
MSTIPVKTAGALTKTHPKLAPSSGPIRGDMSMDATTRVRFSVARPIPERPTRVSFVIPSSFKVYQRQLTGDDGAHA